MDDQIKDEFTSQDKPVDNVIHEEPALEEGGDYELEAPEKSEPVAAPFQTDKIYPEPGSLSSPLSGPHLVAEPVIVAAESESKFSQIKKYFLYVMIGGLILSAIIAITAVLIGEFNDFMSKSVFTTLSIVVHSLVALAFVSVNSKHHTKTDEAILNILFGITVASFITSVLALWEVMTGSIVGHLYLVYLYALVAAVLCRALLSANRVDKNTRMIANASIVLTIFLFLLLMPSVFVEYPNTLPDIYYRGIAATAILLGTTSVLTAIFHRLYVNKHPEAHDGTQKRMSTGLKIFIIIIVIIFVVPAGFSLISGLILTQNRNNAQNYGDDTIYNK